MVCQILAMGVWPGTRFMNICGSYVGLHFSNIGHFEVYEGIRGYMKVYGRYLSMGRYSKVYGSIWTYIKYIRKYLKILARWLARSPARSLARSLARSHARSLDRSLARSFAHSLSRSNTRAIIQPIACVLGTVSPFIRFGFLPGQKAVFPCKPTNGQLPYAYKTTNT